MQRAMTGRTFTVLCGLLLASCTEQASIGMDGCYQGIACESLNGGGLADATDTSSAIYERLPATWTLASVGATSLVQESEDSPPAQGSLAGLGGLGSLGSLPPLIATGSQKTPWIFAGTDAGIKVLLVDGSGELLGERMLLPPSGSTRSENALPSNPSYVQSHPAGPVLTVSWNPGECEVQSACAFLPEIVMFGLEPNQEPQRIGMHRSQKVRAAFRSRVAERVIVPIANERVVALAPNGNVLWERMLPADLSRDYGFFFYAFSNTDELLISLTALDPSLYTTPTPVLTTPFPLLAVTESATRLIGFSPYTGTSVVSSVPMPIFPPVGTPKLVSTTATGDIVVYDMADDPPVGSTTLIREDYLDLISQVSAIDESGVLHLVTMVGGRQYEERVPLLCRLPPDLSAFTCFEVDAAPSAVAFGEPNVVYAVSALGLSRYDLPPLVQNPI
jgi:hypothetical protein